jgi:hypothetical protein
MIFEGSTAATGENCTLPMVQWLETMLVSDINPGPAGSLPDNGAAALNGFLIFTANIMGFGRELWRTDAHWLAQLW